MLAAQDGVAAVGDRGQRVEVHPVTVDVEEPRHCPAPPSERPALRFIASTSMPWR